MTRRYQAIANAMRKTLHQRFPHCFRGKGAVKWPLKINIGDDIETRCPDLNPHHVRFALVDYTRGPKYLCSMLCGTPRRDLDGKAAGSVSQDCAKQATYRLGRIKAGSVAASVINGPAFGQR